MRDVVFRAPRPEEAEALTRLAVASKRHWGYADPLVALWRDDLRFTPESLARDAVIVAEHAGRLAGVAAVSLDGAAAELEGLWVHPSEIGRGLGRDLLRRAVAAARARGAATLVVASDPHAEGFYLRLGGIRAGSVPSAPPGRRLPRLVFTLAARPAA